MFKKSCTKRVSPHGLKQMKGVRRWDKWKVSLLHVDMQQAASSYLLMLNGTQHNKPVLFIRLKRLQLNRS